MSEVRIRIGGTETTFKKSASLVAIKRRSGALAEAGDIAALTTASRSHAGRYLGGFELLEVAARGGDPGDVVTALRKGNAIADATEVFHTSDDQVPFVPTGEIYVEFHDGATKEKIHAILDRAHLAIHEARDKKTFILKTTLSSRPVLDVICQLQEDESVKIAEPDLATFGALKADFALPSDALLSAQWHLKNVGFHRNTDLGFTKGADARVIEAWEHLKMLGRRDVIVAVIDDGFDLTHPDLRGPGKIVAPHDFTQNSADPSPDPRASNWHGTACAGVAVGSANGQLIVGAAPACRLMPVRWSPDISDAQVERWFDWVREQGAWVLSCSWTAPARLYRLSTRMKAAITRCAREGRGGKGIVICFAAGNENRDINNENDWVNGFAIHPDVIAVAACTSRDQRSNYSNFGKDIWVCAPSSGAGGWGITTSDVGTIAINGRFFEGGFADGPVTYAFGGTSSACPLVAGICALVLSANPDLTAAQVKEILRKTARRIGDDPDEYINGHSRNFGYGCVNAFEAVKAAQGI